MLQSNGLQRVRHDWATEQQQYFIVHTYHIFSIHSSPDGHLGCLHVLVIVNSAALNTEVDVSFWTRVFSRYLPRSRIAISCWYYCLKSCPTCDPMDCSLPGSSVHGISQARILEWVAISFSRGSSQPRNRTHISCFGSVFFTTKPPGNHFQKLPGVNSFPCPGSFSAVIVFISNIVKYIFLIVFHFGYFPPIIIISSSGSIWNNVVLKEQYEKIG